MVAMQQSLVSSAAMSLTTAFSENTAAQTAKEVDWRTPTTEAMGTGAHMDSADLKLGHRVYNKNGKVMAIDLNRQMDIVQRLHGQAAPANPSTLGSRQGLSEENWPTPTAVNRVRNEETMEKCLKFRQSNGQTSVPLYLEEKVKQWATPQAHDAQGPKTPEQIAVMRAKGHGVKNLNEQAQWGTPTARDHKSGRGNEEREYKELTPMVERTQTGKLNPRWVETLMGLPVGWVMPSCKSPVTIELTNCASSATESSQQQQNELFAF